jgi:hypothetical protein
VSYGSWQATVAPPVTGKMEKGIALCYTVVFVTFYPVAISGYWAFGNQAQGNIFDNLVPTGGPDLLPQWLVGIASIAIVVQLLAIGLVCRHNQLFLFHLRQRRALFVHNHAIFIHEQHSLLVT